MPKNNKKNLFSKSLDSVLSEMTGSSMFGGAAGGSPGQFSHTSRSSAKTWSPESTPYKNQTGASSGYNIKDIADDDADRVQRSAKRLPFPLDNINDFLVNSVTELEKSEIQIKNCLKYNTAIKDKKEKYALLERISKRIKLIKNQIREISSDIDRISFN